MEQYPQHVVALVSFRKFILGNPRFGRHPNFFTLFAGSVSAFGNEKC